MAQHTGSSLTDEHRETALPHCEFIPTSTRICAAKQQVRYQKLLYFYLGG
jgi:hypothetical protein